MCSLCVRVIIALYHFNYRGCTSIPINLSAYFSIHKFDPPPLHALHPPNLTYIELLLLHKQSFAPLHVLRPEAIRLSYPHVVLISIRNPLSSVVFFKFLT